MGNQMFQFALSTILAKKNNSKIFLDRLFFDISEEHAGVTPRKFQLGIFKNCYRDVHEEQKLTFEKLSILNRIKRKLKLNYPKTYIESSFHFHPEVLNLQTPIYLSGYFQSYKYFLGHENLIRNLFKFPIKELDTETKALLAEINKNHSVSIHIRRGDYITNKNTQKFHGNCDLNYYKKAIDFLLSKKSGNLFFFSDDIEWVKAEFSDIPYTSIFISNNQGNDSWKDMFLMSNCNYNIIANSSFSWWAAWLNSHENKKVIAPKIWFANKEQQKQTIDLIPPEWLRL